MTSTSDPVRDIALEFAKTKLEESYRREESIKESATMQIAILSFLITAIVTLEIALYENEFRLFSLTLIFSVLTIFTMLSAVLFAILSQWRMTRNHFPKASEVVKLINKTQEDKKVNIGKDELIGNLVAVADSMDENNDKRTKRIMVTHILAVISIFEMILFTFTAIIASIV